MYVVLKRFEVGKRKNQLRSRGTEVVYMLLIGSIMNRVAAYCDAFNGQVRTMDKELSDTSNSTLLATLSETFTLANRTPYTYCVLMLSY